LTACPSRLSATAGEEFLGFNSGTGRGIFISSDSVE